MVKRETLELTKAFYGIAEPIVRRCFYDLIKIIGRSDEGKPVESKDTAFDIVDTDVETLESSFRGKIKGSRTERRF